MATSPLSSPYVPGSLPPFYLSQQQLEPTRLGDPMDGACFTPTQQCSSAPSSLSSSSSSSSCPTSSRQRKEPVSVRYSGGVFGMRIVQFDWKIQLSRLTTNLGGLLLGFSAIKAMASTIMVTPVGWAIAGTLFAGGLASSHYLGGTRELIKTALFGLSAFVFGLGVELLTIPGLINPLAARISIAVAAGATFLGACVAMILKDNADLKKIAATM